MQQSELTGIETVRGEFEAVLPLINNQVGNLRKMEQYHGMNYACFEKGHTPPHKGKKLSAKGLANIIAAHRRPDYKGKGELHYKRKGKEGIIPLTKRIRASWQYRELRNSVFLRDKYICAICKKKKIKKFLRLDHIKPFYFFPADRLNPKNCRILCRSCDFKFGFNYNRDKHLYQLD